MSENPKKKAEKGKPTQAEGKAAAAPAVKEKAPDARSRKVYHEEVVPYLMKRFAYTSPMQVPASREDRGQHGRRGFAREHQVARRRGRRSAGDHRAEGGDPAVEGVDRELQAPRRRADRRDGHPAGAADVGVPRSPSDRGDPDDPRLPGPLRRSRSTAAGTTRSASKSRRSSRRSSTRRSRRSAAWTSRWSRAPETTRKATSCSRQ